MSRHRNRAKAWRWEDRDGPNTRRWSFACDLGHPLRRLSNEPPGMGGGGGDIVAVKLPDNSITIYKADLGEGEGFPVEQAPDGSWVRIDGPSRVKVFRSNHYDLRPRFVDGARVGRLFTVACPCGHRVAWTPDQLEQVLRQVWDSDDRLINIARY